MQLQPPPQKFLSTLLLLREYYAPIVEKYEKLYTQALDNLNHVEALLSNWSSISTVDGLVSTMEEKTEVFTVPESENLSSDSNETILETEVKNLEIENLSSFQQDVKEWLVINEVTSIIEENVSSNNSDNILEPEGMLTESNDAEVSATDNLETDIASLNKEDSKETLVINEAITIVQENLSSDSDNGDKTLETEANLLEVSNTEELDTENLGMENSSSTFEKSDEQQEPIPSTEENATQTPNESRSESDIPMLPEYQSLRRIEAVQILLQKHIGSICNVDFVTRALYGELEPDVLKIVRGRVQSTMTQGKNSKIWSLVPGKRGYYTLDLKLLNFTRKNNSSQAEKNQHKKSSPQAKTNGIAMMGEFEGLYSIDAISVLLEKNPGTVFSVVEIVNKLYGELNEQDLNQVKGKLVKDLSRGHSTGRFSRVPGKIGFYTWDSRLITQES